MSILFLTLGLAVQLKLTREFQLLQKDFTRNCKFILFFTKTHNFKTPTIGYNFKRISEYRVLQQLFTLSLQNYSLL